VSGKKLYLFACHFGVHFKDKVFLAPKAIEKFLHAEKCTYKCKITKCMKILLKTVCVKKYSIPFELLA